MDGKEKGIDGRKIRKRIKRLEKKYERERKVSEERRRIFMIRKKKESEYGNT